MDPLMGVARHEGRRRFVQSSLALAGTLLLAGCTQSALPWQRPRRVPRIGFLASTVILGVVMQVVIFRANWLLSLMVSAVLAAGGYWLFSEMLSIPLP